MRIWRPGGAERERHLPDCLDRLAVKRLAAEHDLEPVMVGRVVRAGDHDAAIDLERRRGVIEHRGRPAADAHDVGAALGEPLDKRGFEFGRGQPAVIADRSAPPAGLRQDLGEHPAQGMGIGREQGRADNAADVVFAQDRRIETVRHGGDHQLVLVTPAQAGVQGGPHGLAAPGFPLSRE